MLQENDINIQVRTVFQNSRGEKKNLESGFRVRSGVKSGNWLCSSCEGKTMGSNLFQPHCKVCVKK